MERLSLLPRYLLYLCGIALLRKKMLKILSMWIEIGEKSYIYIWCAAVILPYRNVYCLSLPVFDLFTYHE